jgi:hypothetical protein
MRNCKCANDLVSKAQFRERRLCARTIRPFLGEVHASIRAPEERALGWNVTGRPGRVPGTAQCLASALSLLTITAQLANVPADCPVICMSGWKKNVSELNEVRVLLAACRRYCRVSRLSGRDR